MIKYFNFSLRDYNSFGIDVSCDSMVFLESEEDIVEYLPQERAPLIFGGGSNMLLVSDIERECIKLDLTDIEIIKEDSEYGIIRVGGGVEWHDFVLWAIEHDFGGIENLSLIPGTVGAAPIQNIGAYGVELDSCVHQVYTYNLDTGKKRIFSNAECEFGYRHSIFKAELKGQYLVYQVEFILTKSNHRLEVSYAPLKALLSDQGISDPTMKDISQAVIAIRESKLPDPKKIGNAGSFFKNPIVSKSKYDEIQQTYPQVPSYPMTEETVKIPAAWLIDQCGWKGRRKEDVGVHKKHALVLVNYGAGTGKELYDLSEQILQHVNKTFGILLEREVNVIGL